MVVCSQIDIARLYVEWSAAVELEDSAASVLHSDWNRTTDGLVDEDKTRQSETEA